MRNNCHLNLRQLNLGFLFRHWKNSWRVRCIKNLAWSSIMIRRFVKQFFIVFVQRRCSNWLLFNDRRNFFFLLSSAFFPLFFHMLSYLLIDFHLFQVLARIDDFITSKNFLFGFTCSFFFFLNLLFDQILYLFVLIFFEFQFCLVL